MIELDELRNEVDAAAGYFRTSFPGLRSSA